jgi:hypothetical protein
MKGYDDGVVLKAELDSGSLAFHVSVPLTDEDLRRLAAMQELPGMADVVWTGSTGGVR